jgi:hypothetical protein
LLCWTCRDRGGGHPGLRPALQEFDRGHSAHIAFCDEEDKGYNGIAAVKQRAVWTMIARKFPDIYRNDLLTMRGIERCSGLLD